MKYIRSTYNKVKTQIPLGLICLISIAAIAIRLPSVFQELPPYLFCDESIYFGEVKRLLQNNSLIVGEFRAGGFNIIPILIPLKFINIFWDLKDSTLLIFGRIFYLIIIYGLGAFYTYKLCLIISKNFITSYISLFLYFTSPYIYSMGRYWYPDHYIYAFSTIFFYYLIILNNDLFNKRNCFIFGALTAIILSIKYTGLLIFPIVLFAFLYNNKILKNPKDFIRPFLYIIRSFFITFLVLNYSIIFKFQDFLRGYKFNIQNYGEHSFSNYNGAIFYFSLIFFASFTPFFIPIFISGFRKVFQINRFYFYSSIISIAIFITVLGTSEMVINRNISLVIPLIIPIASIGLYAILSHKSSYDFIKWLTRIMCVLPIAILIGNFLYSYSHDLKLDSRIIAEERLTRFAEDNLVVGTNEFCSGDSPAAVLNMPTSADPFLKNNYKYYVLNSYWPSALSSSLIYPGVLLQPDQKYLHFYNFNDTSILRKRSTNIENIVLPEGFLIRELITSNGPDIYLIENTKYTTSH
jgi:4-amino-4-deoxy-L-arabinose transferase-like glycosyltransferase